MLCTYLTLPQLLDVVVATLKEFVSIFSLCTTFSLQRMVKSSEVGREGRGPSW